MVNDAELASGGDGGLGTTLDVSSNGSPANSLGLGSQVFLGLSVAADGRGVDDVGDTYYLVSPTTFLMLIPNAAGSTHTPVIDIFEQ